MLTLEFSYVSGGDKELPELWADVVPSVTFYNGRVSPREDMFKYVQYLYLQFPINSELDLLNYPGLDRILNWHFCIGAYLHWGAGDTTLYVCNPEGRYLARLVNKHMDGSPEGWVLV